MNDNQRNIIVFQTITEFIGELKQMLGKRCRDVLLFNRFLVNVTVSNSKTISQMLSVFSLYFVENHNALIETDSSKFTSKLCYSDRLSLDFKAIFELLDDDSRRSAWMYLLKIYAIVIPGSGAKVVLMKLMEDSSNDSIDTTETPALAMGGNNFLSGIYGTIEEKIKDYDTESDNAFDVVGKMMTDGVFTDILKQMQTSIDSGDINVADLLTGVTGELAGHGLQ